MVMSMVNSSGPLPGLVTDSAEMSRGIGGCPRMAIFPNLYVPAERDLSTGSNFNPPEADKSSKYFNVWMPVPLYLSGVVIIFAFLDLGKNISFSDSLLGWAAAPKWAVLFNSALVVS